MATRTDDKSAEARASVKERRPPAMTDAHKAALAEGREQGQVIRRYLEAVEAQSPRKGRRRTPEMARSRLEAIESEMAGAPAVIRLQLVQERLDLLDELERAGSSERMRELEDAFVQCARAYSDRKGISHAAWREIGVSAAVLKRAGIVPRASTDLSPSS
jgi:hypothetical protein